MFVFEQVFVPQVYAYHSIALLFFHPFFHSKTEMKICNDNFKFNVIHLIFNSLFFVAMFFQRKGKCKKKNFSFPKTFNLLA